MASLLCNPLFWVAVIPSILLIAIIVLMVRHHNVIQNLNRQLSNFDGNIHIEHDVNSIRNYVRIIAYIAIAFCVGVAIHYLAVELPRVLNNDYTNSHLHNLGVDYLGLIVAIFAIIVTLLVGWQIFSNILERNRFDRFTRSNNIFRSDITKFRNKLDGRIVKLQDCCDNGKEELKRLDNKIDAAINSLLLTMASDATLNALKVKIKDDKLSLTDAFMASQSFLGTLTAVYQLIETRSDRKNILGSISKLDRFIFHLNGRGKFNKRDYDECLKLFDKISKIIKDAEMRTNLEKIRQGMIAIGWDEDAERAHDFFRNLEKDE